MHEWGIAESVVLAVIKEIEKNRLRSVDRIVIKIGELQKMENDILCFAMETLFKEYGYHMSKNNFLIQEEPAIFKCNLCGFDWKYADALKLLSEDEREYVHFVPEVAHGFIKCPSCGSSDFEVEKGRGVLIESIVGET